MREEGGGRREEGGGRREEGGGRREEGGYLYYSYLLQLMPQRKCTRAVE